jgi:flagellar assembly protein FliH
MGVIKRADLESYTRDAVPMDLGDLERRGKAVIESAQQQAAQVLKDAKVERDRLVQDASEAGHQKGYEEGFAKGLEEGTKQGCEQAHTEHAAQLEVISTQWSKAFEAWEEQRAELMLAARTEVIELAAHIAARVIKRTIDLDPEVVVDQLESTLETLVTPTDIRVRVYPSDMELLERVMPAMIEQCAACTHADLVGDENLSPGSCVVSTKGGGTIDASIAKQLDRIVATLLPAHRGPDYDNHLEESSNDTNPESDSKEDAA